MKLKTRKSICKRIKVTGRKKFLRRPTKQDHFNAKDPGQKTRAKRRLAQVSLMNRKKIKKSLPYL